MASTAASTLGRNAMAMNDAPMATPTRRAATPVSSTSEMLLEYVVLGTVPSRPDSRLPVPSAATAPCTAR